MDVAAVLSVLGQGLGRLAPQVAGAEASSDAGPGFSDAFADLAETAVREAAEGDPAGGGDESVAAPECAVLAETVLFFPAAARQIPDLAAGRAEGGFPRANAAELTAGPERPSAPPSLTPTEPQGAESEAVALPAAPARPGEPGKAPAGGAKTLERPDRQADRPLENASALVEMAAPDPDVALAAKAPAPPQRLDAAAPEQAPIHPLQHLAARIGQGLDMAGAPPKARPFLREDEARRPRQQGFGVPLRAVPADRPLPAGMTAPVGAPAGMEQQEAAIAFTSRAPVPLTLEPASGAAPDAGRGQESRADVQDVLIGLASPEGKATLAGPKLGTRLPVGAQVVFGGLPDGGQGLLQALSPGPDLTGAHAVRPSGGGAPHIAHSPHAIGVQLADRMPVSAGQPVEITLAPEELGKVRMTLSASDGVLTLQLVADRPETLDLMRRHIDQLAQDFRDMGFERLSFTFGQGQKEGQQPRQAAPANTPEHESASPLVTTVAGSAHQRAALLPPRPDDRLDLRF